MSFMEGDSLTNVIHKYYNDAGFTNFDEKSNPIRVRGFLHSFEYKNGPLYVRNHLRATDTWLRLYDQETNDDEEPIKMIPINALAEVIYPKDNIHVLQALGVDTEEDTPSNFLLLKLKDDYINIYLHQENFIDSSEEIYGFCDPDSIYLDQ